MELQKALEALINEWREQVVVNDATAIASFETIECAGYFSGASDGIATCLNDLKKILAGQRLKIV